MKQQTLGKILTGWAITHALLLTLVWGWGLLGTAGIQQLDLFLGSLALFFTGSAWFNSWLIAQYRETFSIVQLPSAKSLLLSWMSLALFLFSTLVLFFLFYKSFVVLISSNRNQVYFPEGTQILLWSFGVLIVSGILLSIVQAYFYARHRTLIQQSLDQLIRQMGEKNN